MELNCFPCVTALSGSQYNTRKKACALYLGLAIHFSSFAYSFEPWAKNRYFILRFSFHLYIIVPRTQGRARKWFSSHTCSADVRSLYPHACFFSLVCRFCGSSFYGFKLKHSFWGVLKTMAVYSLAVPEATSLKFRVLAGSCCLAGVSSSWPKDGYDSGPIQNCKFT